MFSNYLEGFLLQGSLIFALGAQNIFVLQSGLKREHPFIVASICTFCDVILILCGVLGAASLFIQFPLFKIIFGVLGVGFLFFYGFMKLKEGFQFSTQSVLVTKPKQSLRKTILTAFAFSLLNPHVYLDTVILIGSYASKFMTLKDRFIFGLGAGTFSLLWFFSLSQLAAFFSHLLHHKKSMQKISLFSGFILVGLSFKLGNDVWFWISTYSQ